MYIVLPVGVLDVNRSVSCYASGYLAFCTSQDLYAGFGVAI